MPRPMMPAPMTAMVWTCGTLLVRLFEISDGGVDRVRGPAQGFGKALALLGAHAGNVDADAAESGRNIFDVVHRTNEFTGGDCHESSFRSTRVAVELSILDAPASLVKQAYRAMQNVTRGEAV